jgi:hypothetical protein
MFAPTPETRSPALLDVIAAWIDRAAAPRASADAPPGADRARRDFMLGMLDDHPDAFCSEADVQCMMHLYPGRF